jgi:tetratricopeptide (TPR) repeat protein
MRTPAFLLCLVLCAPACVTKNVEADLDLRGLIDRADSRFRARDPQAALESYRLAAMIATEEKDKPAFVVAASGVTLVLALGGEPIEAGTWHSQAEQFARPEDGEAWIRFLLSSGALLLAEGLPVQGIDYLHRAWAAALAGERPDIAMQAAQLAAARSEGAMKLAFGRKVLDAALLSGDPTWIAAGHEGLGWIHQALDQSEESIQSFRTARELSNDQPFQQRVRLDWALGRALRLGGQLDEAWRVISEAEANFKRLSGVLQTMGDAEWTGRLAEEQGELAVLRGDLPSALRNLHRAQRQYRGSGAETQAPEVLEGIRVRIAEVRTLMDLARRSSG